MVEEFLNICRDPGLKLGSVLDLRRFRGGVLRVVLCIILLVLKFFFLHLRKRVVSY